MNPYAEQTFNIPELKGISAKTTETHLKLYAGYVKQTNTILGQIAELSKDAEKNSLILSELQRRFAFEFDGMRNHEYFFKQFESGASVISEGTASGLKSEIAAEWGDFDLWLNRFKNISLTRGVGWAVLYYDPITKRLLNTWVDEQHIGHLTSLNFILGLDVWEHAFILDYAPADKKKYVDAFFENLNWAVIEKRFVDATSAK
ncbi:MAG: Fe-Mn family superoxide dismutase [bacterium]